MPVQGPPGSLINPYPTSFMARVALLLLLHPLLSELGCRRWNAAARDAEDAGGRDPRLDRPFILLVEPSALEVTVTNRSRADGFIYFRVNLPYPDCANPEVVGRYDVPAGAAERSDISPVCRGHRKCTPRRA